MKTEKEVEALEQAVLDDVTTFVAEARRKHDGRLLLGTLLGVAANLASDLLAAKVHTPRFIARYFTESLLHALEPSPQRPLVVDYDDGAPIPPRERMN